MTPMRRAFALMLGLFLAVGCGGGTGTGNSGGDAGGGAAWSAKGLVAGSRLTPVVWNGSDGSNYEPQTFHDNFLNIDCNVLTASDGSKRCLPKYEVVEGYRSDPSCSSMAVVIIKDCTPPTLVTVHDGPLLCGRTQTASVFQIGAKLTTLYSGDSQANCGDISQLVLQKYDAYALGPAVAFSQFVEFTRR